MCASEWAVVSYLYETAEVQGERNEDFFFWE